MEETTIHVERAIPVPPQDAVRLTAQAERSDAACGSDRLRSFLAGGDDLDESTIDAVTHPCFRLEPGGSTTLKASFLSGGEPARPKGTLHFETSRGKLSATRVELDGMRDSVEVGFKAPDETIRISVRAFLEGFARGKLHLHMD